MRRVVAEPADARPVSKFGLGGARDARLAGLFNAESSLLVPLFAQQELVGSLLVYAAGRRRRFSALEVAELGSVGEQAAIAIHNAQLYRNLAESQASIERLLARLTRIRDQERQALARVVHDDIVQSIVGAIYRFDDVRDAVTGDQAGAFDQAVAGLRRTVDDARRVIWELRPPAIDGLGLPAALRSLADRAAEGQAAVDVSIEGDADLSDAVTTGLYKIAREALMNALHHADARRIGISLVPAATGRAQERAPADRRRRHRFCRRRPPRGRSLRDGDDGGAGHTHRRGAHDRLASPDAAPGSRSSCRSCRARWRRRDASGERRAS